MRATEPGKRVERERKVSEWNEERESLALTHRIFEADDLLDLGDGGGTWLACATQTKLVAAAFELAEEAVADLPTHNEME